MIPATLTDADLTTILDGCASERMELVARIRGKPGLCEHGEEQGSEVHCLSDDCCPYQRFERDHTHLDPIVCGREAAALAAAEQHQEFQALKEKELDRKLQEIISKQNNDPRLSELTKVAAEAAEESGRLK